MSCSSESGTSLPYSEQATKRPLRPREPGNPTWSFPSNNELQAPAQGRVAQDPGAYERLTHTRPVCDWPGQCPRQTEYQTKKWETKEEMQALSSGDEWRDVILAQGATKSLPIPALHRFLARGVMFRLLKGVLAGALFCFVLVRVALLFRLAGNGYGHAS